MSSSKPTECNKCRNFRKDLPFKPHFSAQPSLSKTLPALGMCDGWLPLAHSFHQGWSLVNVARQVLNSKRPLGSSAILRGCDLWPRPAALTTAKASQTESGARAELRVKLVTPTCIGWKTDSPGFALSFVLLLVLLKSLRWRQWSKQVNCKPPKLREHQMDHNHMESDHRYLFW